MKPTILKALILGLVVTGGSFALSGCSSTASVVDGKDTRNKLVVSVRDQRMLLLRDGKPIKTYPVSTSKFGLGSRPGSFHTPLGNMEIARKIGDGQPIGMVFKGRNPTGEVLEANAPGRDPIVSRILWLNGKEPHNSNTFSRLIYIHGTTEERRLGRQASYGCIRMGIRDVVDLYNRVGVGAEVTVIPEPLLHGPGRRHDAAKRLAGVDHLGFTISD